MSDRLALQRCWHHSTREAVARCPECGRFFCRECVVEHEDRVICSGCLAQLQAAVTARPKSRLDFTPLLRFAAACVGIIVGWILFFSAGRLLLAIPDSSHARDLWERGWSSKIEEGMNP
jgi:hypothetical protein